MFAISCTAKVPGRMILLIVSIQTINGIKNFAVVLHARRHNKIDK